MFYNRQFINMGEKMFVVKRTFKVEQFQKVMDKFPTKEICAAYHCDTILKGRDGLFFLVDEVSDAVIVR